ncbi:MAG: SPOR domain-containing protein [Candidatus Omnitrophota bacterium]
METEKSYVEIKVSFIHIVVLFIGVFVIGVFLFYLGYQAGKSSIRAELQSATNAKSVNKSEELNFSDDTNKDNQPAAKEQGASLKDEMRLHQLPGAENKQPAASSSPAVSDPSPKDEQVEPAIKKETAKAGKKAPYYAVQVGAFSDHSNAEKYAAKFSDLGYPIAISPSNKDNKKLFRVWVGNFKARGDAQRDREKLEKSEKRQFSIVSTESE